MYPAKPGEAAAAAAAAPVTGVPVGGVPAGQWSSGLLDCSDDCGLCCVTCWCP